jgi:hypothetical protein
MATEPDETATGERTYRAVFERSPDAVLILEADSGAVVDANDAASDRAVPVGPGGGADRPAGRTDGG